MNNKNIKIWLRHAISVPFIFSLTIPFLIMDFWVEIYHRVSFFLYRVPYIKRQQYITIDRYKLSYLTWPQKIFCSYCGYINGVLKYWAAVAQETERYWCAIKHKSNPTAKPQPHQKDFTDYGHEFDLKEKFYK